MAAGAATALPSMEGLIDQVMFAATAEGGLSLPAPPGSVPAASSRNTHASRTVQALSGAEERWSASSQKLNHPSADPAATPRAFTPAHPALVLPPYHLLCRYMFPGPGTFDFVGAPGGGH